MNIGIDSRAARWYRGTGIGTYTYQLINSLNKVDATNQYLLFMPDNKESIINLNSNFRVNGITEDRRDNFWDEINIPNILENSDIDLYHVPQNGVGLPDKKNCCFVITLHDVIPCKMPQTVSERYLRIFSEEMPQIISNCDGIITVSNYSKKDIVETFNFPQEKIFVTELAAEDIYRPLDLMLCKTLIKQYYSIEDDYILYIGGFSPRKNIIGLIEAFSRFKIKYKKAIKLVIAGKQGASYSSYLKRTRELHVEEDVIFPGFIPIEHLPGLYNAAKLFVYPSLYEGFGLPPVEAMSCGTPVITSNVTSIPEVTGDSALLVDPYDIDSLSNAMYWTLSDENLRQKLIIKGFVRASELNWKETAKKTIIAYSKTVNN